MSRSSGTRGSTADRAAALGERCGAARFLEEESADHPGLIALWTKPARPPRSLGDRTGTFYAVERALAFDTLNLSFLLTQASLPGQLGDPRLGDVGLSGAP